MLKLIPHIADGSWLIKQSVGTTPVILGKALKTTYHETPQVRACQCRRQAHTSACPCPAGCAFLFGAPRTKPFCGAALWPDRG